MRKKRKKIRKKNKKKNKEKNKKNYSPLFFMEMQSAA